MLGRVLSHYEILEEIGRGRTGVAYRAHDRSLGRDVAFKLMHPGPRPLEERVRRLADHVRALAAIEHPGVSTVYEVGSDGEHVFVVMELICGTRLSELVAEHTLGTARSLEIATDVAELLAAVHEAELVHSDVATTNAIVTPLGRTRLVDFSMVRPLVAAGAAGPAPATAVESVSEAPPSSLAPEVVEGRAPGVRSDVYAFGTLLFELLAGYPAVPRGALHEVLHAIVRTPPPRLAALPEGAAVTADLRRILEICLAKDPEERYLTMRQVLADVRAAALRLRPRGRSGPVPPRPPTIRTLLADDVPLLRTLLREQLRAHPDVEVVGECADGFETVKAVSELRPDLLLLDVQMPRLNGLEVLDLVGREVAIVFVTAYDEYAMQAMDAHAVDYVVKPVEPARLRLAIERVRTRLHRHDPAPGAGLLASRKAPLERLLVRQGASVHVVALTDLLCAESGPRGLLLRCSGADYLKKQTLDEFATRLDPARFVRIHRDRIVNADQVASVEAAVAGRSACVVLRDGTRLEASVDGLALLQRRG